MTDLRPDLQQVGYVYEVFASIQGEGLYTGQRQTFVRFAGCNLTCDYCDTPSSRERRPAVYRIEKSPGSGVFYEVPNPTTPKALAAACKLLASKVVSVTGGEPLYQPEFAAALASELKADGFRVYLETNGTLREGLESVLRSVDVLAMDIKLPSAAGCQCWEDHAHFLAAAQASEVETFVKAVVSSTTGEGEISHAARIVSTVDRRIPMVIQPMTGGERIAAKTLMRLQDAALAELDDVRVIPQCHKMLEVL